MLIYENIRIRGNILLILIGRMLIVYLMINYIWCLGICFNFSNSVRSRRWPVLVNNILPNLRTFFNLSNWWFQIIEIMLGFSKCIYHLWWIFLWLMDNVLFCLYFIGLLVCFVWYTNCSLFIDMAFDGFMRALVILIRLEFIWEIYGILYVHLIVLSSQQSFYILFIQWLNTA